MAYEALDDWLDPALVLTAAGHEYRFPVPTARTVVEVKRLFAEVANIDDAVEATWSERIAGPELYETLWDAPEVTRRHVLRTGLIHYGMGEEVGRQHWVGAEIAGKVLRALEEQETTSPSPAPTGPTTPAAARTTKRRASGTGTTRRRTPDRG